MYSFYSYYFLIKEDWINEDTSSHYHISFRERERERMRIVIDAQETEIGDT